MSTSWISSDDDAALEEQAQRRAEEALSSLDEATRAAKLPTVKAGILKSLKNRRAQTAASPGGQQGAPPQPQSQPPPRARPTAPGIQEVSDQPATPSLSSRAPPPVSQPSCKQQRPSQKPPCAEACGDEIWFADVGLRESLLQAAAAAHAAHKIVVAAPAEEIRRILPSAPGRSALAAGAVLRLGGALHGGYGEADIKSVYRQLSRALHPDKNLGVPEAPEAFKRLSDCAEELKKVVADTQKVLQRFCLAVGATVTPAMLERPQGPLLAEASRLLAAVVTLTGEGAVSPAARARHVAAFAASPAFAGCVGKPLLPEWYDTEDLLEHFTTTTLRTAFDCMPKRFRVQFLCLLNRVAAAEAERNDSCVRATWQTVFQHYPEVTLWRDILHKLRRRVAEPERGGSAETGKEQPNGEQEKPPEEKVSAWARWWRKIMTSILPCGEEAALPLTDKEVGLLALALWEDFAEWAVKDGMEKHFNIFSSEENSQTPMNGSSQVDPSAKKLRWAFIPAADILLAVGEGLVGVTAEGVFIEGPKPAGSPGSLLTFAAALRRERRGSEKRGLSAPAEEQKVKQAKLSKDPTRIVLLTNLGGAGKVVADLQKDIEEEAGKYGKLLKFTIREVAGAPENEAVRIFLEFEKLQAATKTYSAMNGRYFGGRPAKARFFDEDRYSRGELDRRSNSSVILVTNLVAPEDVDDELQAETLAEARGRFGKVKACKVDVLPGAGEHEAVRVFLDFELPEDAAKAVSYLNGRTFGSREAKARFYDEERYRTGDLRWTDPAAHVEDNTKAQQQASTTSAKGKRAKKMLTFI